MICQNCGVETNHDTLCGICEIVLSGQAPGVTGCSDGPGTMNGKTHFCTPKPYEEVLKAAKATEEAGRLTPKSEAFFRNRLKRLEPKKGGTGMDYQKDGYPV